MFFQYSFLMRIIFNMMRILFILLLTTTNFAFAGGKVNKIGMTMIDIPAGSFAMGTCKYPINDVCLVGESDVDAFNHEAPQHRVSISAFQLSQTEVTLKQFKQFIESTGHTQLITPIFKDKNRAGDDAPVVMVSWDDAQAFITWLNKTDGGGYRLPSESEWEYACRAGSYQPHCGGPNVGYLAWYSGNSANRQHTVAKKLPNAFGLYDMSGNVWEWVQDCWHDGYVSAPANNSDWSTSCQTNERVRRGGSWYDYAEYSLAAYRSSDRANRRNQYVGFRVARSKK